MFYHGASSTLANDMGGGGWTLSLILRFNLRLGGYSIWSAIFMHPIEKITFCRLEIYSG